MTEGDIGLAMFLATLDKLERLRKNALEDHGDEVFSQHVNYFCNLIENVIEIDDESPNMPTAILRACVIVSENSDDENELVWIQIATFEAMNEFREQGGLEPENIRLTPRSWLARQERLLNDAMDEIKKNAGLPA